MQTIKVTAAIATQMQTQSWAIINEDYVVGVYKSRQAARDAKAESKLAGSVKNVSEFEIEVVNLAAPAVEEVFPLADLTKFAVSDNGIPYCPKCGSTEVFDGEAPHGHVINEDVIHGCHECDWLVDDRKNRAPKTPKTAPAKTNGPILHRSEIIRPCKRVWVIADEMKGAKRGEVLAACVAEGIAYYTARTQYQQWLGIQKEMAARESQQAK